MSNRLGGSMRGSAYLGTNAVQPPDCVFASVSPTQFDTNHSLLDLWLNETTQIVYVLVSLAGNSTSAGTLATWVPLNGGGGGNISSIIPDQGIDVIPDAMGDISVLGGSNIHTVGTTNTLTVFLNDSIFLPATTTDTLAGVIGIGPAVGIQMYGTANVFVGSSGNFSLTGINNSAIGEDALSSLSSGNNNSALGVNAGQNISSGSNNTFLGYLSGSNLTGTGANNIMIGNIGLSGDANTIRIGTSGSAALQQNKTFIAGIYANADTLNADNGVVIVDTNNLVKMTRGTDGQLLIGDTGTGPIWANLSSTGGTIAISNGPGSINLESVGGGEPTISCAFLAQNTPNLPNITGDGTTYTYGTTQALTEIFDVGSNFNPATGVFTAPADAQYYLEITVDLTNLDADGGADAAVGIAQIVTTSKTYTWNFGPQSYADVGLGNTNGTISFQQIVEMSANDTAHFTISTNNSTPPGNKVIGLGANAYVSGYVVSGAAFGTTSYTTDEGTAVPTAGNVNIFGGNNISTRVSVPSTILFDVSGTENHSLLLGNGSGAIDNLGVATDGQIPIGSSGADPVLATITAGTNITITNAPGSITINATGGGTGTTWNPVSGTTQSMVANNGYYCQNSSLTSLTLPVTAAAGTILEICGAGTGAWVILQNSGQSIKFLGTSTTVGATGTFGTNTGEQNDAVMLLCTVANTTWVVTKSCGNFSLV